MFVGILTAIENSTSFIPGVNANFVHVGNRLAVGSASTSSLEINEGKFIISSGDDTVFITDGGAIGIGTTSLRTNPDDADTNEQFTIIGLDRTAGLGGVGIGTTALQSLVDFSSVGLARTEIATIEQEDVAKMRFMLPPKLTDGERAGLTTVSGAMIYNITTINCKFIQELLGRIYTDGTSSSGSIKFSEIKNEFGDSNGSAAGVSLGNYRVSQTYGEMSNMPLDEGIPQSGTITMSNFHGKRLNVVVNYYSGGTENRPNTGSQRYTNNAQSECVGEFKDPPSGTSGSKVWLHVNKTIGSQGASQSS